MTTAAPQVCRRARSGSGLDDRLLYIMGTSRSGSTALQILLSQAKGAFGAGELTHIADDLILAPRTCSCGDPACELWAGVRQRLGWTRATARDVGEVFRQTDGHRAILGSRGDLATYGVCNRQLLRAIRAQTGARVIIDGSKFAARALALNQVLPVRVICLTRSLRGLRRTWTRRVDPVEQQPKSTAQVVAYWASVRPALRFARGQLGDVLPVSYEQLATDPATTLGAIGDFADLDLAPVIKGIQQGTAFEVGHLLRGNRIRRQSTFTWLPTLP